MPDQDFNLGSGFGEAIGNYNEYQNGRIGRAAKEQSDAQNTSIVHNVTDGTVQVNMPADVFKEKAEAAAKYDQISAIYMKQVQELEAQRAQIKAHPFANTLAQIAGSMAANDVNPITRGLGQAALRLNPSDAELQAREQVPLRGALETAEAKSRSATTSIAQMDAQARLNETIRSHYATEAQKAATESDKKAATFLSEQRRELTHSKGNPITFEAYRTGLERQGIKDSTTQHYEYARYLEEADSVKKGLEDEAARKAREIHERGEESRATARVKAQEQRENTAYAYSLRKDFSEGLARFKTDLKQDERLSLMTDKNKDKLGDLLATEKYIDRVAAIMSKPEYASMAGFKTAALKDIPKYLKGADRIEFENLLAHETPRLLSFIVRGGTGGASIIRSQAGVKMLQALGISGTETPEAAFRIMKNINNTISEGRLSIAAETPKARYGEFKELFGKDAEAVVRKYSASGTKTPTLRVDEHGNVTQVQP